MRRILVVSPHFPPVNAADHQRARMMLPYLCDLGWEPTLLTVEPRLVEGATLDPLLEQTYSAEVEIVRVKALPPSLARRLGLGSLALRALPSLWRAGIRLLQGRKFDLVFFSTTQFPVMMLGPIWKRRFGVPYVVDFQDPWLDDYYERTNTPPPGGKLKHSVSRQLARRFEPKVMRDVSEVITVSPAYAETLGTRYPHLRPDRFTVIPFAADEKDFELAEKAEVRQTVFDASDGKQHWVYVGRGGRDMAAPLELLFQTISNLRQADGEGWSRTRLHFIGTSYAPAGRGAQTIKPVATKFGVDDLVEETTDRVSYFVALKLLREADALMVIGSESVSYSASKLYPYLFARKPMLAVLHQDSPGAKILRDCEVENIVTFEPSNLAHSQALMARALQRVFEMVSQRSLPVVDQTVLARFSACEMTRRCAEVFDSVIGKATS